ncbi:ParB/RepB/Spo0J family partition protein [Amylibacter sp. IMCC11727]|uniref:ParB/RepB/Spo0J family partition protein n=1 Tax=Amylibacter sp. IMCC11727 TaxID=3039851 RepID=UPI00244DFC86|nr:ParB/RepB/Spo0J family partition protein [Amylibacter sp. IMCC11727]WGI22059.1 ParB/RepB/Spo0J family partition protein [Amylibacter sp. IMCC11727]
MAKKKTEKRGLGRGLSALMADINEPEVQSDVPTQSRSSERLVPITRVHANPDQPRRTFDHTELRDLAKSILTKGIIQPLIVRPDPNKDGEFQIVAGERRWRAAQTAKLDQVPVVVRDLNDLEVLEIGIIENIQRADLNPVDEANGYHQLMEKFGHTQEKLSEALGKSRSYLANSMRLLNLPSAVQDMLVDGRLTAGHARALVPADNALTLAKQVVEKGLSVRQTEALVKRGDAPAKKSGPKTEKDSDTVSLETDLAANLGMKVNITHKSGTESGTLSISYKSFDDLDALCQLLSATNAAGSR